jgi:starch phosphorylase
MEELMSVNADVMDQATSTQPQGQTDASFRSDFCIGRDLPNELAALSPLSMNFAWSWLPGGGELFRDLSPRLWDECEQNPRLLLKRVDDLILRQWAADSDYIGRLTRFEQRLQQYLLGSGVELRVTEIDTSPAVAYFCAEYGIHNSLPNYSGGLGILAGDHLKSASDLKLPLVAIGLLYRFGYFRQRIAHNGLQEEAYLDVFRSELALTPVVDANGDPILVEVHIRGREVACRAWLARVGRVSLYLLDTNLPQNSEIDRLITGHLYGGDQETRIVQEKVLGIGGVRLLRRLGIGPKVFHLNEGHSAFLTLELAHEYLGQNPQASFDDAVRYVRQQCVFTTHTPVDAGNDAFNPDTLQACFSSEYIDSLKISRDTFYDLGRTDPSNDSEYFGMTPLALRMCRSANGVSKKHGEVSRRLWLKMHPELKDPAEVPITSVTNGVHPGTWIAPVFQSLYQDQLGDSWTELTKFPDQWADAVNKLSDDDIWVTHQTLKRLLVAYVRKRLSVGDAGTQNTIHESLDTSGLLSPEVLTIGFARRVAAYKRWDLILTDVERLLRLVDDPERPVQFVFAGKAHPQDATAKEILQRLMTINHNSGWQHRAVFIEDYDQEVARYLVHGVDVWMNVPRRPLEASGTSGMKAAMNGVLNLSILDGWWMEGFNGENGFAVGGIEVGDDPLEVDREDAESLYSTLEDIVVPTFYAKDTDGMSPAWVRMMKNSIAALTPRFSSDRMVNEYLIEIYKI